MWPHDQRSTVYRWIKLIVGRDPVRPYYDVDGVTIYHGDCRDLLGGDLVAGADLCLTDPPYGDTSLGWDARVEGWQGLVTAPQLWCFGSLRFHLGERDAFLRADWKLAQEVVWEKHNGSGFHADRFKRVHELAVHYYRGEWGRLYKNPPVTMDATARTVRKKGRPTHTGHIDATPYVSEDGGPRLMRSVLQVRSEHGRAVHPTQKPLGIMRPLIQHSCPQGGLVIDPFMGSGSSLIAARDLGRRAIGIEVDETYCEAAVARLAQTTLEVAS